MRKSIGGILGLLGIASTGRGWGDSGRPAWDVNDFGPPLPAAPVRESSYARHKRQKKDAERKKKRDKRRQRKKSRGW